MQFEKWNILVQNRNETKVKESQKKTAHPSIHFQKASSILTKKIVDEHAAYDTIRFPCILG